MAGKPFWKTWSVFSTELLLQWHVIQYQMHSPFRITWPCTQKFCQQCAQVPMHSKHVLFLSWCYKKMMKYHLNPFQSVALDKFRGKIQSRNTLATPQVTSSFHIQCHCIWFLLKQLPRLYRSCKLLCKHYCPLSHCRNGAMPTYKATGPTTNCKNLEEVSWIYGRLYQLLRIQSSTASPQHFSYTTLFWTTSNTFYHSSPTHTLGSFSGPLEPNLFSSPNISTQHCTLAAIPL